MPHDQEHDAEIDQFPDDVPVFPVFSAEHNIFTDRRVPLGISNLMTSFVSVADVRSADSGNVHRASGRSLQPGAPL